MPAPNPAPRPNALDGCWSDWTEQDQSVTIRSEMESGLVKTRRRFTGRIRRAQVGVILRAELYQDFVDWFVLNCQQGVRETQMKDPLGVESVWRFVGPPQIRWDTATNNYFRAFAEIEKLPGTALTPTINQVTTDEAFFALLTFTSANGAEVIRVVNNLEDVVSRGDTFTAYPFQIVLPEDADGQTPIAKLTIDNVDQLLVKMIREFVEPPILKIEIILSSAPDVVERTVDFLRLSQVQYNASQISGDLVPFDLMSAPAIDQKYDQVEFPVSSMSELVGIKYQDKGRTFDGVDCWGAVLLWHRGCGAVLPDYSAMYHSAEDGGSAALCVALATAGNDWQEIEQHQAEAGDVLVFRIAGFNSHCGVMINRREFLHSFPKRNTVIENLSSPAWGQRLAGVYRWNG